MNARTDARWVDRHGRRVWTTAFAIIVLGGTHLGGHAEASRFRANSSAMQRRAWGRYLGGGPSLWSTTPSPRFPSGARLPIVNGGLLQTPFVDYLFWRRELNPSRFDFYHPTVGRIFEQLVSVPPVESIVAPSESVIDPVEPPAVNPVAQEIVPEPGTLALGASILGAIALWRRQSRR